MKTWMYGLVAVYLGLAGCAGKQKMMDVPADMAAPDENLIWSSESRRPVWTLEEPATENGMMRFVGLSGNYATEQDGRDDAKRNSISSVVSYTGTLVKDKFERARVSFGLDSSVVDPTTSARNFERQLAVNVAKQVKARNWYIEKWKMPTGVAYRVFLLAEVPQTAVDETLKGTAREMAKKAEQQAKEAADEIAKKQAEKAAAFWKQMQEQGLTE